VTPGDAKGFFWRHSSIVEFSRHWRTGDASDAYFILFI